MHIAGRDGADLSAIQSQGERKVQQSSCRGLSQGVKAGLSLTVFHVRNEHERRIEKDLLDFGLADPMFVFALAIVTDIPIEPFDFLEVDHACIFS
jgi:hypothetical protein